MAIDRQIKSENLLLVDRTCRTCGGHKNLLSDFYLSRIDTPDLPSSYSYECKECARIRIKKHYSEKDIIGTCCICNSTDIKISKGVCKTCNNGLKQFKGDIDIIKNAMLYLQENLKNK